MNLRISDRHLEIITDIIAINIIESQVYNVKGGIITVINNQVNECIRELYFNVYTDNNYYEEKLKDCHTAAKRLLLSYDCDPLYIVKELCNLNKSIVIAIEDRSSLVIDSNTVKEFIISKN